MTKLDTNTVNGARINLADFPVQWSEGEWTIPVVLQDKLQARLDGPGYAVCYGVSQLLSKFGMTLSGNLPEAQQLHLQVFSAATAHHDMGRNAPSGPYSRIVGLSLDGYNRNTTHNPASHTNSREFQTVKCMHFDAATPIVANVYGPFKNIAGGFPVLSDVPSFCKDRGLDQRSVVARMNDSYNLAVRPEFHNELIEDYSILVDADFENDMVMVIHTNEVESGIAHGATTPYKVDPELPAARPLYHIEYQHASKPDYDRWWEHYHLSEPEVGNSTEAGATLQEYGVESLPGFTCKVTQPAG